MNIFQNKKRMIGDVINDTITHVKLCSVTNEDYSVTVTRDQMYRHQNKELAQDVFPELSNEQREFIISGITPDEWNFIFGDNI